MMCATDIAARLNLRRYPRSWRGRCPCCDYRVSTFALRTGKDGSARLFCANGCTTDELVAAVARATGQPAPPQRSEPDPSTRERNRERALALWRGSEPATGTVADLYLTARGLPGLAASSALRFRGDTPHPDYPRLPAMIALVSDAFGSPIGIHRTYLARSGSKASVEPVKASLGPIWGGAIRLHSLEADKPLVIGEGIETAASAGRLMGLPAWASISAGNLAKGLLLPPEVRSVVIAADPDKAGRDAARDAWLRWKAEGREIRIALPDREGCDFNDVVLAKGQTDA
jgi:putative DNA primase/helicase